MRRTHSFIWLSAAVAIGVAVLAPNVTEPGEAAEGGSSIPVPAPGAITSGVAGFSDLDEFVGNLSFEVQSVSIYDITKQQFRVFIPEAPEIVNAGSRELFTKDSIVWVRRGDSSAETLPTAARATNPSGDNAGQVPAAANPPRTKSAAEENPGVFPVPAPGQLTFGVSGTSSPSALAAAQLFDVAAIIVQEVSTQGFNTYIPGAPEVVNTLTSSQLRPDSIVWIRRAHAAPVGRGPAAAASPPPTLTPALTSTPVPAAALAVPAGPILTPVSVAAPASTPAPTATPVSTPVPTVTATATATATATPTSTPTPRATATPAPAVVGNLIRRVTYEAGETRRESAHTATADGLLTTTEAARSGSRAGVALLGASTPQWKGTVGFRSEWHGVDTVALGVERWHGISYYLPADWHQGQRGVGFNERIVYQFHTSGGPGWSPMYGLLIRGDQSNPSWAFYRKDRYTKGDGSYGYRNTVLWQQPAVVGEWIDFVWHAEWTADDSGYIEFYRNRQRVYSASGLRTMTSAQATIGPYSKWGIYGQPTRILFDEMRIAEGPNQLGAVSP